jgi:sugar PTS system EIIA component
VEVLAPISGEVVPLSEVPDEVFAEGMAGDGVAIVPARAGRR